MFACGQVARASECRSRVHQFDPSPSVIGVGCFAFEALDLQVGDVLLLDCLAEVFGAIGAPMQLAVAQGYVVRFLEAEANGWVRFDGLDGGGGTVVVEAAFVFCPAFEGNVDVVEQDVVGGVAGASPDANAVFGAARDVLNGDVMQGPEHCARLARDRGEGDGFAASPPWIGEVL